MSVYIDLTEFLANPVLSGIQRVTAQLCRHWPGDDLKPVRFTSAGYLTEVERELIAAIGASFENRGCSVMRVISASRKFEGPPARLGGDDVLIVPELFYDAARVAFYRNLNEEDLDRCRFIIYDLTPIVHPEYFPSNMPMDVICGYFQMIRRIRHCGFISEATQQAYCNRLLRSADLTGAVLRLGSDGLGPRPENVSFDRPMKFTVLGRVEPMKNPALVVEAFEPLLARLPGLQVTFLGKMGCVENAFAEKMDRMSKDRSSGLVHRSEPTDDEIRNCIDESRATVFVSGAEGFGLPPVESLWRGTPVIISSGIPSVEKIGSTGLRVVDPLTVESLRAAILEFWDISYGKQKIEEALTLNLPTWRSFAGEVCDWCHSAVRRGYGS